MFILCKLQKIYVTSAIMFLLKTVSNVEYLKTEVKN